MRKPLFAPGKIVLAASVLALVGALGWSVSRGGGAGAALPVAETSGVGEDRLATLEQRVAADPRDAEAALALGAAYFDLGRFADAARIYDGATKADPKSARAWSALGEALVMASQHDPMPVGALDAFRRAVAIDPADPRARYFLAVRKDLDGDHLGAVADWLALLADTPPGAPWERDLVRTIEQVGKINRIVVAEKIAAAQNSPRRPAPAAGTIPGPGPQDLAGAAAIPPSQQRQMAEGMVARLEARLAAQPANIDGWVMLMRSRMTLGQGDLARKALADGVAANPGSADRLRQEAAALGVR